MDEKKLNKLIDILNYSAELLKQNNIKDARLNIELMLAKVLNCERIQLYLDFEKPLKENEISSFKEMLKRRLKHEPLQYILGETYFYGNRFIIENEVFIPRPDTEILVESVLEEIMQNKLQNPKILEICSGTGCVSISVYLELIKAGLNPAIQGIESSLKAVKLSYDNAKLYGIKEGNISFRNTDFLQLEKFDEEFDYIIMNPPYISLIDFNGLDSEVKDYEPVAALTDKKEGLIFYEKLFKIISAENYKPAIFCEIGFGQREKIEALLSKFNILNYSFRKDYGNIDRVVKINNNMI